MTIKESLSLLITYPSEGDVIVGDGDTATGTVIDIEYDLRAVPAPFRATPVTTATFIDGLMGRSSRNLAGTP